MDTKNNSCIVEMLHLVHTFSMRERVKIRLSNIIHQQPKSSYVYIDNEQIPWRNRGDQQLKNLFKWQRKSNIVSTLSTLFEWIGNKENNHSMCRKWMNVIEWKCQIHMTTGEQRRNIFILPNFLVCIFQCYPQFDCRSMKNKTIKHKKKRERTTRKVDFGCVCIVYFIKWKLISLHQLHQDRYWIRLQNMILSNI